MAAKAHLTKGQRWGGTWLINVMLIAVIILMIILILHALRFV